MKEQLNKIQEQINDIYALAHILNLLFEETENLDIRVNSHCIASFGKMITCKVLLITDLLDNHSTTTDKSI